MPSQIDHNVLLATAHIQTTLKLVPCIIGPKEAWAPWMRGGLEAEMAKIPKPSTTSPHSRLLESLDVMFPHHYSGGMSVDTLCFHAVHADDPLIMGPEYVDMLPDAYPEISGDNHWWESPPPSVSLRVNPPPSSSTVPLEVEKGSSKQPDGLLHHRVKLVVRIPPVAHGHNDVMKGLKSKNLEQGSDVKNSRGKKWAAREENQALLPKKHKKRKSSYLSQKYKEDDLQMGQSMHLSLKGKGKGKADVPTELEGSEHLEGSELLEETEDAKVCDVCKSHGSSCQWPTETGASGSQNESLQHKVNEQTQIIHEFTEWKKKMENMWAAENKEKKVLLSRIANLELQVACLKAKIPPVPE
ncbi:hypothetical protein BS17DRAFT_769874 [Gyrodon lividus]|nr:hypothetical protein BS17DRAFT_769874 [Gyrodon lividus]